MSFHQSIPFSSILLQAIAAVHELATDVEAISVSEMLPRTRDLIFVNVKTQVSTYVKLSLNGINSSPEVDHRNNFRNEKTERQMKHSLIVIIILGIATVYS